MLILSRKRRQVLVVGTKPEPTLITVLEIREGLVRLGIDAPKSIVVNRKEVHDGLSGNAGSNQTNKG